uniref:Uncharacterized protein n=2 Tax=Heterosigma akashiwo TaxID=2829 RepID=A0A6V1LKE2_HETAK
MRTEGQEGGLDGVISVHLEPPNNLLVYLISSDRTAGGVLGSFRIEDLGCPPGATLAVLAPDRLEGVCWRAALRAQRLAAAAVGDGSSCGGSGEWGPAEEGEAAVGGIVGRD